MKTNTDYELNKLQRQYSSEKTSHLVHFVLSLLTGGFWVPIWILSALSTSSSKSRYERQIKDIYEPPKHEAMGAIGTALGKLYKEATTSKTKSIAERRAEYEAKGYAL